MTESPCLCHTKLVEIQGIIAEELHDCKEKFWNHKISSIEKERDLLLLRNNQLRCQLAELQSKVAADPFISRRCQELSGENHGLVPSELEALETSKLHRQLLIYADHNKELEERLSQEQTVSMSWKYKFNDLERKIGKHVDELLDLTKDQKCIGDVEYNKHKTKHYCDVAKEALQLLKLAKARIDGDKHRLDSYVKRVSELENYLSQIRLGTVSPQEVIGSIL
ncbi:hypothetical protein BEWA_022540 [Theileria equi strain WA]|uniref:Uncharacterized protein n=1 Tax=Theileria equi strain WA TaxID=1537102 RepID=L0AWL6_THEEQ|nr:hypothetical protein BEWA_022540 [Theileria equi strain WA]AFZ79406.1 hypothetical protein BEWA_022540 [Theileria equi strain WA]|eukprot:XP_004829072.1 hypothetical protein BEWA_022540 [Theileria equi strain WA]